jgi:hypothetical protein
LDNRSDAEAIARILLSSGHLQPVLTMRTKPEFEDASLYKRAEEAEKKKAIML